VIRTFDTPITTNDHSIDRVLAAGQPVSLVFKEGMVPPAMEQTMKRLAREHAGELLVVQVPAKDSPATVRRYQINRFPAVVTVRDGEVLSKAEAVSGPDLEKHAAFLLGRGPRPQPERPPNGRSAQAGTVSAQPQVVTDATFDQEVLRSSQPVLVDFWAPWCGPCRMVAPTLDKLARELAGRLRVAKVNVDENPAIAQRYGIQSIPTMMVVKNGQIADRWAGALPESSLRSRVMPFLG
jgi:thioredoxin 1